MSDARETGRGPVRIGFRTSIITVVIAAVLVVGLTLVYLSFRWVSSITQMAASTFIDKVGQIGAYRIDAQFKNVRDNLEILAGIPAIQEADVADNVRLYALLASMLRNNPQIFNLYVGYEDGSFLEMDVIDRAKPQFRTALNVAADAVYRVVVIAGSGAAAAAPVTLFLSENLTQVAKVAGPHSYDPRQRPWYVDALKDRKTLLTGPYVFYATGEPGYTLRTPLREGRRGVVAADLLLNRLEEMLSPAKARKIRAGLPVQRRRPYRRASRDARADDGTQRRIAPDRRPQASRPVRGDPGLAHRRARPAVLHRCRRTDPRRGLSPHRDGRCGQHPPRGGRPARRVFCQDHLGAARPVRRRARLCDRDAAVRVLARLAARPIAARAGAADRRDPALSARRPAADAIGHRRDR
ncbi:cache domain-containing protein [Bradyrhizobium sp. USDA 3315]